MRGGGGSKAEVVGEFVVEDGEKETLVLLLWVSEDEVVAEEEVCSICGS